MIPPSPELPAEEIMNVNKFILTPTRRHNMAASYNLLPFDMEKKCKISQGFLGLKRDVYKSILF